MTPSPIPNGALKASLLPPPNADLLALMQFALTYEGYTFWGQAALPLGESLLHVFERTRKVPSDLDTLRGALFVEQRRWRHYGYGPDAEGERFMRALLEGIREVVVSGVKVTPPEPQEAPNSPRALKKPEAVEARRLLLDAPHAAPLALYVRRLHEAIQERDLDVPDLDPVGGGIASRVLFLLEAPGPKASRTLGGSGFISMDNDDPTAQNVFTLVQGAGLPREWIASWNIVPWYVGEAGRIRPVRDDEIALGREHLRSLLAFLPHLRVVVTLGRPAAKGWAALAPEFPGLTTLRTWHPSGQSLNPHPTRREHVLRTFRTARILTEHALDPAGPGW